MIGGELQCGIPLGVFAKIKRGLDLERLNKTVGITYEDSNFLRSARAD
jgi:hypothetical protein